MPRYYIYLFVLLSIVISSCDGDKEIEPTEEVDPLDFSLTIGTNEQGSIWMWETTLILIQDMNGVLIDSATLQAGEQYNITNENVKRFTLTEVPLADIGNNLRRIKTYYGIKAKDKKLEVPISKPIIGTVTIKLGDVESALFFNNQRVRINNPQKIGTAHIKAPDDLVVAIEDNGISKYRFINGVKDETEIVINKADFVDMSSQSIKFPDNTSFTKVNNDLLINETFTVFDDMFSAKKPLANPLTFYYPGTVFDHYIPNFSYKVLGSSYRNYYTAGIPTEVIPADIQIGMTNKTLGGYSVSATGDVQMVLGSFSKSLFTWDIFSDNNIDASATTSELVRILNLKHPEFDLNSLTFNRISYYNTIGLSSFDEAVETEFGIGKSIYNLVSEIKILDEF